MPADSETSLDDLIAVVLSHYPQAVYGPQFKREYNIAFESKQLLENFLEQRADKHLHFSHFYFSHTPGTQLWQLVVKVVDTSNV